jgi:hypothetical protein
MCICTDPYPLPCPLLWQTLSYSILAAHHGINGGHERPSTSACCMARIPRLRRLFVWRLIANPSEKRPVQRLIWLNFQKYRRTQYCSNQINVWFFLMAPAWIFNKIECFSQYNRALKCNGAASLRAGLCFFFTWTCDLSPSKQSP